MLRDVSPQRKVERQQIIDAIESLRAKGWDINPYTVADEAKIARSALYRDSELMELVTSSKIDTDAVGTSPPAPAIQSDPLAISVAMTQETETGSSDSAEWDRLVQELQQRSRELEALVSSLRDENEALALKEQDAWQDGYQEGFQEGLRQSGHAQRGATASGAEITDSDEPQTPVSQQEVPLSQQQELVEEVEAVESLHPHIDPTLYEEPPAPSAFVEAGGYEYSEGLDESAGLTLEDDATAVHVAAEEGQYEADEEENLLPTSEDVTSTLEQAPYAPQIPTYEESLPVERSEHYDEHLPAEEFGHYAAGGQPAEYAADEQQQDPGYVSDEWLAQAAGENQEVYTEAAAETAQPVELPPDFQPIDLPIDAYMAEHYVEDETAGEPEPVPESDVDAVPEEMAVTQSDLQNLLNKRFGRQTEEKEKEEAAKKGAGTKFVGGSRQPQDPPPQGFVMRNVPPDIRKACLVLGLRPEELSFETVHKAWKKEITNPGSHPDIGGDTEIAVYLNTAKDQLYEWLEMQAPKLGKKFGVRDVTRPPGRPPGAEAADQSSKENK